MNSNKDCKGTKKLEDYLFGMGTVRPDYATCASCRKEPYATQTVYRDVLC